ncbi:MAG: hypothetical protein WAM43_11055 [Terriglobales bacterium]
MDDKTGARLVVGTWQWNVGYLFPKLFGRKSAAVRASPAHACDLSEQFRIFVKPPYKVRWAWLPAVSQQPLL